MNVEYINPFINSTINALTTMCSLSPTRGKPYLKTDPDEAFADISAIIGSLGRLTGGWPSRSRGAPR
jgi:chemotaxis protein CheX